MNVLITEFILALESRYPDSKKEVMLKERPEISYLFQDYSNGFSELEKEEGFEFPQLVKDLHSFMSSYFVYIDTPACRCMCNPAEIQDGLNWFRELAVEQPECYGYYIDRKIPFFAADGDYDLLDFTQYSVETDDCPIVSFNHEVPMTRRTVFPSVRRFIELLTIELKSGDRYDYNVDGDYERYKEAMRSRGTHEIMEWLD